MTDTTEKSTQQQSNKDANKILQEILQNKEAAFLMVFYDTSINPSLGMFGCGMQGDPGQLIMALVRTMVADPRIKHLIEHALFHANEDGVKDKIMANSTVVYNTNGLKSRNDIN